MTTTATLPICGYSDGRGSCTAPARYRIRWGYEVRESWSCARHLHYPQNWGPCQVLRDLRDTPEPLRRGRIS